MNLQKAILSLHTCQEPADPISPLSHIDARALLIATLAYLVGLLSVPLESLARIIWFAIYPILLSPIAGVSYSRIFINSLYVLPVIMLIGIFNPIFDHRYGIMIGDRNVSMGWITFFSIIARGLLSMQALLLLVKIAGFRKICGALSHMGLPKVMTAQLMMVYRFMGTLFEEALTMKRAVAARGYGKKSFAIKIWRQLIGSLLLRTIDRAKKIHDAMLARGFYGEIYFSDNKKWGLIDYIFCSVCIGLFLVLRMIDISQVFIRI